MVPQVISHYRVIKKIGAGGMSEVYLATDTVLGRNVALKVLSQEAIAGDYPEERFTREAQSVAKLDHPNICSVYEVGSDNDLSFIVMQYIEGETLASKILCNPGLEDTIDIASQVADGLAEAHSKGIIHRDVKPQNIMITARGQVKVLDFGLAKLIRERHLIGSQEETESLLTGPGTIVGTLPYLSPEQARGEVIDARSDIFSLGVVIYEMLSGRQPFKADSKAATLSMILTHEPPPLARFLPEIPGELQRIVGKALCKNKERRYQTVRDLQIDLTNLKEELSFEAKLERSKPQSDIVGEGVERRRVELEDTQDHVSKTRFHRRALIATLAIFVIGAGGVFYFFYGNQGDSVAVLPFVFTSTDAKDLADPDSDYLSDGVTESVINRLSQFPRLRVIARSSVFRYKGKEIDPQQVGRELGVRTVFVGRIIQRGDNLTIKSELSDVRDNVQIWGEQYDRKVSALLDLQKEISETIVEKLRLKLTGEDRTRLTKSYTDNGEAYELYLKGRYYWNKRTEEGFRRAITYFQQAIGKDPRYALAYTGLADSYMLLSDWGFLAPVEGYSMAKNAVAQALRIDDRLAEAHTSLAGIKAVLDWDWAGAENEYRAAIELNPNYATAHHWYATHLIMMGRVSESLAEIKRALLLDPLSLGINKDFAVILLYASRYDQALEQCNKTLEIDPNFLQAYVYIAQAYELKGMHRQAIEELQKAHNLSVDDSEISCGLALAYAAAGMTREAQKILSELGERPKTSQSLPREMALLHARLGETDEAFDILLKACENHYFSVTELNVDPRFDGLRSDARFFDLLRCIRLRQ